MKLNWYKVTFVALCVSAVVGFTNFVSSTQHAPAEPDQITIEFVPSK